MKKIYQFKFRWFLLMVLVFGCKKMNSTYEQYKVPGGITYAGKATSPIAYSGRNRIKIAWQRGADPNVAKAKIYWNNYQDSVNVPITQNMDTVSALIENLAEQQYNFIIKTYDTKGNVSVPVELIGESFGEKYEAYLVRRPVISSEVDENGILTITWDQANVSGGAYATDVKYTDRDGQQKIQRCLISESSFQITNYKMGTSYEYRTVYRPSEYSIDSFFTIYRTEFVSGKIKKQGLVVTTDSYAATSQLPKGGPAQFAFDDDITTFWHTHHTPAPVPGFPHWLAVDLNKMYVITRAELTCRPGVTNTFTQFTLQGSLDGRTWTNYGEFTLIQKDPTQSFTLNGLARMQYFRIFATEGPKAYANLAEFTVYGYE